MSGYSLPSVDRLVDDLRWALKGPLPAFYKNPKHEHEREALTQIVKYLRPDMWEEDPNWALRTVVKEALEGLPSDGPKDYTKDSSIGWREIGEFLCGFRIEDVPPKKNGNDPGYGDYLKEAIKRTGLSSSERTLRDAVPAAFRNELAKALLKLKPKQRSDDQPTPIPPAEDYVPRPELEAEIRAKLLSDRKLVVLKGDAGTGKSRLAEATAKQLTNDPNNLIVVSARTSKILSDSLAVTLDRHGIDCPARDAVLRDRFRRFIEQSTSDYTFLIDNVDESGLVEDLIPAETKARIIVTGRAVLEEYTDSTITIGNMTSAESVRLVELQLPDTPESDAERLADALDRRPLAIAHACGFLKYERGLAVQQFLRLLQEQISRALDMLEDNEPTLTAIYTLTLERLDEGSLKLLDLIVSAGGSEVPLDFLATVWSGSRLLSLTPQNASVHELEIRKYRRRLYGRSLLWETYEDYEGQAFIWMHPLTCRILRELRVNHCSAIYQRLIKLADSTKDLESWQPGKTLPLRIANQTRVLSHVLGALSKVFTAEDYPRLAALAALIVRGVMHSGFKSGSKRMLFPVFQVYSDYNERILDANRKLERWEHVHRSLLSGEGVQDADLEAYSAALDAVRNDAMRFWKDDYDREYELRSFLSLCPPKENLSNMIREHLRFTSNTPNLKASGIIREDDEPGLAILSNELTPTRFHSPLGFEIGGRAAYLKLRRLALEAEIKGNRGSSAFRYFCFATHCFDEGDFRSANACYERSYRLWNIEAHPHYIGELCKASSRVSETYRRMGSYRDAEDWKENTLQIVREHLSQHGLGEWTPDPATNVALYRMASTRPAHFPLIENRASTVGELQEGYTQVFGDYGEALADVLLRSKNTTLWPCVIYRSICATAIKDPIRAYDDIRFLKGLMDDWGWSFASERLSVDGLKILMHLVEQNAGFHPSDLLRSLESIDPAGKTFHPAYQSPYWAPYWSADALLTAYVIRARYRARNDQSLECLFEEAWAAHYKVKRLDRMKIAFAAREDDFNPLWLLAE